MSIGMSMDDQSSVTGTMMSDDRSSVTSGCSKTTLTSGVQNDIDRGYPDGHIRTDTFPFQQDLRPPPSLPGRSLLSTHIVFTGDSVQNFFIGETFQPLFNVMDTDMNICQFCNTDSFDDTESISGDSVSYWQQRTDFNGVDLPSLAIVLFLQEVSTTGNKSAAQIRSMFNNKPWKLHHRDYVSKANITASPENAPDYFYITEDLPLCAVRQVHMGKQHLRFVRFVSQTSWQDMVDFYELISGCKPEVVRSDFCLFTTDSLTSYNVQLALKRLPRGVLPRDTKSAALVFAVQHIGNLVPLLPSMCKAISKTRWQTIDCDGNVIYFDSSGDEHKLRNRTHGFHQLHRRHVSEQNRRVVERSKDQRCREFVSSMNHLQRLPRHSIPANKKNRRRHRTKDSTNSDDSSSSCLETTLRALLDPINTASITSKTGSEHRRSMGSESMSTSDSDTGFRTLSDSDSMYSSSVGWPPVYVRQKRPHTRSVDSGEHMGPAYRSRTPQTKEESDRDLQDRLRPSSRVGFYV